MKHHPKSYTVLIVDGNRVMAEFMELQLQHIGVQTALVSRGDDALRWLRGHHAVVMLVDVNVPDMSDDVVTSLLSATRGSIPIPCIVLTAPRDESTGAEMVRRGAHDFLSKDGNFFRLLQARVLEAISDVEKDERLTKATDALQDSEQRLGAIMNTVVYGMITINEKGIMESFNKAAERIFGYTSAEVISQNVSMLMPEPYKHEHDGHLDRYMKTKKSDIIGIGREVVGQRKDGTIFPMSLAVSEARLKGRVLFTGIIHDLTKHKRVEKEA